MTASGNSAYVHIGDIRQCFVDSQFFSNKKKIVSINYHHIRELKDLLDELPLYYDHMMSSQKVCVFFTICVCVCVCVCVF